MSEVFDVTPDPSDDEASAEATSGLPTPIEYLVQVTQQYQVVMLGDRRGVSEHLAVLRDSIPALHEAGVLNLAWEFTNTRRQADLDAVTQSDEWDRRRAIELFIDLLGVGHGYEDYLSVIEAVWRHNTERAEGQSPFRMIALGLPTYVEDPDLLDGRSAGETALRNWWMGGHYRDVSSWHMANTITAEVLQSGERVVVYADADRTNTRFVEWIDDVVSVGPGNLLHNWVGEGIARVLFHGALADDDAFERIEQLIAGSPDPELSFGLDLETSTLGNVRLLDLAGSLGPSKRRIELSDVAHGYLYVQPRSHWTRAELIVDFLSPASIGDAEQRYRALDPRSTPYSLEELEAVRSEGHSELTVEWPPLADEPADPESKPKRRFGKRR